MTITDENKTKQKKRKQLFFSLALTLANCSSLFCILSMQNKAIFVIKLQISKYLFLAGPKIWEGLAVADKIFKPSDVLDGM